MKSSFCSLGLAFPMNYGYKYRISATWSRSEFSKCLLLHNLNLSISIVLKPQYIRKSFRFSSNSNFVTINRRTSSFRACQLSHIKTANRLEFDTKSASFNSKRYAKNAMKCQILVGHFGYENRTLPIPDTTVVSIKLSQTATL